MKRVATVILCMAASAVLFLLAMPPSDQSYFAWFMFVPLFVAVRGVGGAFGFLCGLGTCLLAAVLCSTNLFYPAIVTEADNSWVYTGLSILGLLVGIVSGFVAEKKSLGFWAVIGLAAFAVVLEWATGILLTANIGITQYRSLAMLTLSSFAGIWSVSFLVWLTNLALAAAIRSAKRTPMVTTVLAIGGLIAVDALVVATDVPDVSNPDYHMGIHVAAIQAADPLREEISELNKQALAKGATLAVWPELSGSLFVTGGDTSELRKLAATGGHPSFVTSFEDAATPPHNVAALFHANGESMHYEKRRLFGGEKAIRQPGDKPASHGNIGLNICFDSCYPSVIRDTARLPGVAIIALPNHDPASPNGFVQAVHAAYTPFRAAENGVALIRADSSGYSMIVDKSGRIVALAKLGTAEVITAEVSTTPRDTFYKRFGDWFLWLCGVIVAIAGLVSLRRRKRGAPEMGSSTNQSATTR